MTIDQISMLGDNSIIGTVFLLSTRPNPKDFTTLRICKSELKVYAKAKGLTELELGTKLGSEFASAREMFGMQHLELQFV